MPSAEKCGICNNSITKSQGSIMCKMCNKWIHAACANINEKDLAALKSVKSSIFTCVSCENCQRTNPNRNSISDEFRSLNAKLDGIIMSNQTEKNSIKAALDEIKNEMRSYLTELKSDINSCNEKVSNLKSATDSKISDLQAEVNVLHRRLNRADFLISGLPAGLTDLVAPVMALSSFFNVSLSTHDINYIGYISNGKQILVKLNNVNARDLIMKEYFRTRTLKVLDIIKGEGGDLSNRVYLNDHYTPAAAYLNSLCIRLRRQAVITNLRF
ncbi:uncharacterized protein LOC131801966 [Musca domestica]|uniref:Uncharacterized protein LOC131801966 n=1 Tax=Musca domestica TaxID=7370 RepID=A0ABM3UUA4_MUSDO|nr:uncharacterized protein LOC131801966 [Musca domestica]